MDTILKSVFRNHTHCWANMSKHRVSLLSQMRTKLTLDEENWELSKGVNKEEEDLKKLEGEGEKSESETKKLPEEGNPPQTLEALLLSDIW